MDDAIRKADNMTGTEATADASTTAPEDPTELRLRLHRNGYRPIPVLGAHVAMKGAGKRPMMKGWETVCASADEAEIARWTKAQRNCTNTGLLCGALVGIDIDVLDPQHAHRVTCIATEMLGMTPACRIGRAPKTLLAFRTDAPFDKVQTSEFHMLDGTVARVEVLATGQQFVAFGIHPDTKASYHWPERSPLAAYSSAEGDPVELSTTGVFQLPKASAAVLTVGARVAWDNTTKEVTTPAAGRFLIGVAVEVAGNGVTSVAVRLDGVATAAA